MPFKKCFVLTCLNNSEDCENKLFISIPNNKDIRTRWFSAVNRPFTTTKDMYCCEDHFDLEVDMENWMRFKLIGSRVHMKKDAVPHKFIDGRKHDKQTPSQLTPSSRKRKLDTLQHMKDGAKRKVCFDDSSTSCAIPSISHSSPTTMMAKCVCNKAESPSYMSMTMEVKQEPDDFLIEEIKLEMNEYFNPKEIVEELWNKEKSNNQVSNLIKNELVSIKQENGADAEPEIHEEIHVNLEEAKIKFCENIVWNINVKQELDEENIQNYSSEKMNSLIPIKQEANIDVKPALKLHECTLFKKEYNISHKATPHVNNKLKYKKEKGIRRTKSKGSSLNGKTIKWDALTGFIICEFCGNIYTKRVEFTWHFSTNHYYKRKKLYKTKFNKKKINYTKTDLKKKRKTEIDDEYNLNTHLCSYKEKKTLKCDICLKYFSSKSYLEAHLPYHTGEKPYECEICLKAFGVKWQLNNHKRCHTKEKPYKCNVCLKYFAQKCNLNVHLRYHTGEKPFKCEVCLRTFTQKCNLYKHLCCQPGKKTFNCDTCLKYFTNKGHFDLHSRNHTRGKLFKCDICSKCFSQKIHLKIHLRCHIQEKPFKCDICPKSFSQEIYLNEHLRSHTQEKPFKCDICLASFLKKSLLYVHLRCHTGEKPFKCDICFKSFSQKSNLNTHMRCHTEEKPFKCVVCSRTFTQKSNLNKHLCSRPGKRHSIAT